MSDPFRPPARSQLYREAQYGLVILALLIALFVYLAINRIAGHGFDIPESVRLAPVAKIVQPDGSPEGYSQPEAWSTAMNPAIDPSSRGRLPKFEERTSFRRQERALATRQNQLKRSQLSPGNGPGSGTLAIDPRRTSPSGIRQASHHSDEADAASSLSESITRPNSELVVRGQSPEFPNQFKPQMAMDDKPSDLQVDPHPNEHRLKQPPESEEMAAKRAVLEKMSRELKSSLNDLVEDQNHLQDRYRSLRNAGRIELDSSESDARPSNPGHGTLEALPRPGSTVETPHSPSSNSFAASSTDQAKSIATYQAEASTNPDSRDGGSLKIEASPPASSSSEADDNRFSATADNSFQPTSTPPSSGGGDENRSVSYDPKNGPPSSAPTPATFLPLPKLDTSSVEADERPASNPTVSQSSQSMPTPAETSPTLEDSGFRREPSSLVRQPELNPSRPMPDDPVSVVLSSSNEPNRSVGVLAGAEREVVIAKAGESFYSIAQTQYGDGRFFRALYQYNLNNNPQWTKSNLEQSQIALAGRSVFVPNERTLRESFADLCPRADSIDVLRNGRKPMRDSATQRLYVTRGGETLFDIARNECGQASRFAEILEMNQKWLDKSTHHLTKLPAGLRLVLPVSSIQ